VNLSRVLPKLFIGSCPDRAEDIAHLKAEYGVTAILSFQTDHDLDYQNMNWSSLEAHCEGLGIEVRRVAVRDFDGLDLRAKLPQCVEALDGLLRTEQTVYAFCNAGMGRSPSVAIAYLVWRQGWDLDAAIEHVTRCRSCSPNIESLVSAVPGRTAA
jgi:protein-tyrosine phosphatase